MTTNVSGCGRKGEELSISTINRILSHDAWNRDMFCSILDEIGEVHDLYQLDNGHNKPKIL